MWYVCMCLIMYINRYLSLIKLYYYYHFKLYHQQFYSWIVSFHLWYNTFLSALDAIRKSSSVHGIYVFWSIVISLEISIHFKEIRKIPTPMTNVSLERLEWMCINKYFLLVKYNNCKVYGISIIFFFSATSCTISFLMYFNKFDTKHLS